MLRPALSVVVVAFDIERELPRTLRSLSPSYQRDIGADRFEVVVVDNGSRRPVVPDVEAFGGRLRTLRLDPAPPSPATAANVGLREARGEVVGLIVDGARMASPGLLALAHGAARLHHRPVIATAGWHLGPARHMDAATGMYDQAVEDDLLRTTGWEDDGYRLFEISTLAASSGRGWFGPIGESSALFMTAAMWEELGGLDESFALPGGGLVNHDLYTRACDLPDSQLIMLLGEGTFHQIHGGVATSGRMDWETMDADYRAKRGRPYRPPDREALYLGRVVPQTLGQLGVSVELAQRRARRAGRRPAR